MGKPKFTSIICAVLDIVQMALAVLVVVLVSWKLTNVDIDGLELSSSCLLDGTDDSSAISGTRFCAYMIAVGIISFVVNIIVGCVRRLCKCVTLNACGASKIVAVVGDVALGVWWTAAFILVLQKGGDANRMDWPERGARDGVIAASFGAMVAFYADAVVTVVGMGLS